jgi:hypothetical protein
MLYKSKLISILRTLTNKELKRFEEFILSPYFNKNDKVIELLLVLKKHHPEYDEGQVNFEGIFPRLFPKEKPMEQKLRYVMTDLSNLLEEYLSYAEFDKSRVYKAHLLLNAFDDRKLDKYFRQAMDEAMEQQEKEPYRNVNWYFNRHLLEENSYLHSLSREARGLADSLQQAMDNLDLYYLSAKLRFCCVIFNLQDVAQVKYNYHLLDEIMNFLQNDNFRDVPAIAIYFQILMTFREPNVPEHYRGLKEMLEQYAGHFPAEEAKDMYVFALNYCIKKLNSGELEYRQELFELYKALIEKELIFENAELAPSDFKNIVTIGLRSGQVEWTENFIKQYKERIPAMHRSSTYTYNMAFTHYYKREYGKAVKMLLNVEFADNYYHLDAKALLLKTYYELSDTEPFFSLADAFTNYLKRNKVISEYQREVYINFVKFAKKLMLLRTGSRLTLPEVRLSLSKLKQAADLSWLLEKAGELE